MKKLLLFILTLMMSVAVTSVGAAAVYDHEVTFDTNGGDYIHRDIASFGAKLDAGADPLTVLAIGDSTSNEVDEWYYLAAEQLGLDYDAFSVQYKLYDQYQFSYDETIDVQYGTDGDAYALFDGVEGNNITALDNAAFSITGDLDMRAKLKIDDLESGTIIGKANGTGNTSYTLLYYSVSATEGKIAITWSEDGTTVLTANSGNFTVPEDSEIWIRATLDVDNGASGHDVDYYYSFDGITWTVAGVPDTVAGTTSIYDSASQVEIGSYNDGTAGEYEGRIYNIEIRDGIDGQVVGSLDFDRVGDSDQQSIRDTEGNTWFVNGGVEIGEGAPGLLMLNGSIGGAKIDTFTSDILSNLTLIQDIDLIFLGLGHNEDDDVYAADLEAFMNEILVYSPQSKIVLFTQNPQATPIVASLITEQLNRQDQVKLVAARNDIPVIDIYEVLAQDTTTYISTDGVHPTSAGYIIWADQVVDVLNYRPGSAVSEFDMLVEDDEKIIEPDQPTKSGYLFDGWYTNETLTDEWDFETDLVQEDMTLYAKWISLDGTGTTSLFAPSDGSYTLFGIAWYWYAVAAGGAYFLFGTKDGKKFRKKIGLK